MEVLKLDQNQTFRSITKKRKSLRKRSGIEITKISLQHPTDGAAPMTEAHKEKEAN